jgi:uncharacterized cupredoxin-like copper-binding protein
MYRLIVLADRRRGRVMDRRLGSPRQVARYGRIAVVSVALATLAACSGDGGGTVDVTLQEFSIATDPATAEAGEVVFEATNEGPDDVHEFVVFRTDLDPTELPTDENGAVVETGEGIELIGEIEDIPVGETQSVTLDLEAGNYVLICNIFDEDEQEAHYQEGMRTTFTIS